MTKHPRLITAICGFGVALASVHGQPPAAPSRAEQREQLVQRAVEAQTPLKAGAAYKELFQKFGDDLDQLATDSRPGVALNAAWERALRLAAKKQLDPQRFLGFFEGVMRAKLPDEWEVFFMRLLSTKDTGLFRRYLDSRGETPRVKGASILMPRWEHETGLGKGSANVHFRFEEKQNEIQIDDRSITVAPKLANDIRKAVKDKRLHVSAQTDDRFVAIALYIVGGTGCDLYLFDRKSGQLNWTAILWAHAAEELRTLPRVGGALWNDVSIFIGGQTITVFGTETDNCYAESYEIKTGACVFRFSTSLWGSRE